MRDSAAARLNSAYAGNFSGDDRVRARRLSKKAFAYARRATCLQDAPLCAVLDSDPEQFAHVVAADTNTTVGASESPRVKTLAAAGRATAPFIVGPPILHPRNFFGREREIKRIFDLW